MPIPIASLGVVPFEVAGIAVGNGTVFGNHHLYTAAQARITLNLMPHPLNPNMQRVGGAAAVAPAGDTIYLRFFANQITSVRLPVPPPAGINFFITDNMSACKFYIDTITGSNDLIVYHANTTAAPPPAGALANVQTGAANLALDALHTAAQANYPGLVLTNVRQFSKPQYYQAASLEQTRKQAQGRRSPTVPALPPEFVGASTIVGYPMGGSWAFVYQTWGSCSYERPTGFGYVLKSALTFHWNYLRKRIVEGTTRQAGYGNMRVLESAQFH